MRAGAYGFAGIVQQDRQIKHKWILQLLENLPIKNELGILGRRQCIELVDANQRVFVRGVAMQKLVLHETSQLSKLRNVAPEKIDSMHHPENARDRAFAGQDRHENFARILRMMHIEESWSPAQAIGLTNPPDRD